MLSIARTRFSVALVLGLVAVLVASFVVPAHAGPKSKSGKSPKTAASPPVVLTEDNDTNDGNTPNNVVDNNDNRHPSGKDRSVEKGRSGNQGKAKADPDNNGKGPDRSNGGVDQPNGKGGADKADQDGNNGCGNDDDFEDDNEGWCGRKPRPNSPAKPSKPSKPSKPGNGGGNPGTPGNPGNGGPSSKIGICHRTGSATNPYVFIRVSEHAKGGHSNHSGDVIGVASKAACPGGADPVDNPVNNNTPDDVDGIVIVRPPTSDPDPIVIIRTPPRRDPAPSRSVIRTSNDPVARDLPGRVLAATGMTASTMALLAALSLMMGAGLLGYRRLRP